MAIHISTLPLISTISHWFAPSEQIEDYFDGEIDPDILLTGDVVLILTAHPAYGDICGEIIDVDYEHEYCYRVVYQIEGRWTSRWYSALEIAKVY